MTKRQVRWRWGIANEDALDEGKVGVACRGFEHEITLVWSITSGKKKILEDGKEIHFSVGRRAESKLQHSWAAFNNHIFTVIAHASPPLKARPGFKQFDFLIDGMSFDLLPRIFELSKNRVQGHSYRVPLPPPRLYAHSSEREMTTRSTSSYNYGDEMRFAKNVNERGSKSLRNINTRQPQQSPVAPPVQEVEERQQPQDLLSSETLIPSLLDMDHPSMPSLDSTVWSSDNVGTSDSFGYSPNQPPSYEAVYSSIMHAYDTTNCENVNPQPCEVVMPNMNTLRIDTSSPTDEDQKKQTSLESPKDVFSYDNVLHNLVNLDDISSSVFKGYTPDKTSEMNEKQNMNKSLAELKSMHKSRSSAAPTKEIMKNHQTYASANPGAMVLYGQPSQQGYSNYANNYYYGSAY